MPESDARSVGSVLSQPDTSVSPVRDSHKSSVTDSTPPRLERLINDNRMAINDDVNNNNQF